MLETFHEHLINSDRRFLAFLIQTFENKIKTVAVIE